MQANEMIAVTKSVDIYQQNVTETEQIPVERSLCVKRLGVATRYDLINRHLAVISGKYL
jgi:hypothetical protein